MDAPDLPDIAAWQAAVSRVLKGADAATLVARGRGGIPVAPLYGPAEPAIAAWRGEAMPIGIVQPVDSPDLDEAIRLAVLDIEGGATTLTLVLAGSPAARGFGLPAEGCEALLESVDVAQVSIRCDLPAHENGTMLDRLLTAGTRAGAKLDISHDPLASAVQAGMDPTSAADRWIVLASARAPGAPILRADGRPHHEAGASEAQELAAVLATGVESLRALERAGLDSPVAFTLAADADQLFTIAKLRALRRLWARVEALCGFEPKPIALHAETSWRMLARADPWTNLLRNTIACAGAILGGADSFTVLPFTAALGLPDAFARRLARNTPLVLLEEAGLGRVADPLAGSGAVEALTEALCQEAWSLFQDIERGGGLAAGLARGTWQAQLAETRATRAAEVSSGLAKIVSVTAFVPPPDAPLPNVLRPAPIQSLPAGGSPISGFVSVRDAEPFEAEPPA